MELSQVQNDPVITRLGSAVVALRRWDDSFRIVRVTGKEQSKFFGHFRYSYEPVDIDTLEVA